MEGHQSISVTPVDDAEKMLREVKAEQDNREDYGLMEKAQKDINDR
jgi:hypothetical protein